MNRILYAFLFSHVSVSKFRSPPIQPQWMDLLIFPRFLDGISSSLAIILSYSASDRYIQEGLYMASSCTPISHNIHRQKVPSPISCFFCICVIAYSCKWDCISRHVFQFSIMTSRHANPSARSVHAARK